MLVMVLGAIEVLLDGVPIEIGGGKERLLLALLLCQPGTVVTVGSLIDELWSGQAPASAGSSIHVLVSRLRHHLGDWGAERLTRRHGGYVLEIGPDELDATRFTRLVGEGRRLMDARDPATAAARYREGLALWRGEAFANSRSLAIEVEAARLDEARLSAREALFEAELALGHHSSIITELEAVINEHPFHERFWAIRMIALYRAGRQADALRSYQALRARTLEELGFEPTPELQRLELAVLEHDPELDFTGARPTGLAVAERDRHRVATTSSEPLPAPPALNAVDTPSLFGRQVELQQIRTCRAQTKHGLLGVALVKGEPGAGKTRLAMAVAQEAIDDGATVLLGRCDEDPSTAYQPIAEALRWVLEQIPADTLEAQYGAQNLEHLRLLTYPSSAAPFGRAPGDVDRVDLFEAVATVLRGLAREHPVVLMLEDLHWSDPPTAALLRYVVRRLEGERVLLLCTLRDDDTNLGNALSGIIADLRRTTTVTSVDLQGLSVTDVSDLATALVGRPVSADVSGAIHEETNGNALFVVELTRHLIDTAVLGPGPSPEEAATIRRGAAPDSIREVVTRRIAHLDPEADRVLSIAAVAGRQFDLELVAGVTGHTTADLARHVDQAASRGLIEASTTPGHYSFTHALIRHTLYERVPGARRALIHLAIAELLEERGWGTAAQLALHYYQSAITGSIDKAITAAIRAAREAQRTLAFEDSVEVLERTVLLAEVRGSRRDRLELMIELGDARWWAGDTTGSDEACTEALALSRLEGDGELFARAVLARWRCNGAATQGYSAAAPDSDLVEMLGEALAGLIDHPALRAALLGRLGIASYWTAPLERRRELADSAVALAQAAGDEGVLLDALVDRQLALWTPGGEALRLAQSKEILTLARRLGQPAREADARIFEVLDHLALGDVRQADVSIQHFQRASARLRQPYYRWHTHFLPALRAMMDGRFDEAEELSAAGMAESGPAGAHAALDLGGLQMLWLFYERGQLALIAPALDTVGMSFGEIPALDAARTWVAAESGDLEKARRYLDELAANDFGVVQTDIAWLAALCLLGSAAAAVEDRVSAEQIRTKLAPYSGRCGLVWIGFCCGPVDHYLGRLAHCLGDLPGAATSYDAALATAQAMGAEPTVLRIRLDRCRLDLETANPGVRRISELEQVADRAAALGMATLAERATDLATVAALEGTA